jgi:AH receptor-interacting protein
LVSGYPFLSKTLREAGKPKDQHHPHCCGVVLQNEGTGYKDLNQLIKEPCDLVFRIGTCLLVLSCKPVQFVTPKKLFGISHIAVPELLRVEAPEDYQKESWQMNEEEKLNAVPGLHAEGNSLFNSKDYTAASEKYALALGMLEQLMLL